MVELCFCEARISTPLGGSKYAGRLEMDLTSELSDVVRGVDPVLVWLFVALSI